MMLYFNDQVREITFACEPIQEFTVEEIEEVLKENHNNVGHPQDIRKDQRKTPNSR